MHALVLEGRAAHGQGDLIAQRALTQARLDFILSQGRAFQILVEQRFVCFSGGFHQLLMPFLAIVHHVGGNIAVFKASALGRVIPPDFFHADQIDHADEFVFSTNRQLNRHGIATQPQIDLLNTAQEIGAGTIHLVDEGNARHLVLVHLAPDSLGLRLHTRHSAENRHRTVQHTQAALDFDGEIHVPGSIDDVDAMLGKVAIHALPEAGGRSRGDGDTAFLLLLHVIHDRCAVMHFADFVGHAGIKQNAFCCGCLARINVRRNTNISVALNGSRTCHDAIIL